jgi:CubicO group peptidase (beta-lactamase class C family)
MRKTTQIIEDGIVEKLHPGAQLYVWHDGREIIDAAFGQARPGITMTSNARLLWMSAGKPLGAIALLQQIEKNRADLDTRVSDLIPGFAQHGKAGITLRHLLTHTAGFRGPLNSFTPGPWEAILARCCALRQEPNWIPGKKAGYHVASSWFVLGELVRLLDGRPFERYVREEVLARVGARESSVGLGAHEIDDSLALVEPDFPGNTTDALTVCRPPANARGPVRELGLIYVSLLQHDARLLAPEWSKRMVARQREGMFDETFKQTLDWGLGLKLDSKRYGGVEPYGYGRHASDATFGHSGNQCACAFADPEYNLVVAWCANGMPGEAGHQQRQNAINEAIYEDLNLA